MQTSQTLANLIAVTLTGFTDPLGISQNSAAQTNEVADAVFQQTFGKFRSFNGIVGNDGDGNDSLDGFGVLAAPALFLGIGLHGLAVFATLVATADIDGIGAGDLNQLGNLNPFLQLN